MHVIKIKMTVYLNGGIISHYFLPLNFFAFWDSVTGT